MLDFTSALYLGLRHPSASLGPWDALSLGRPAALQEPPGASEVAAELARLQGCEAALLLPSTLHLFCDLFRMLAQERVSVLIDSGAYPIAKWGAERAAAFGVQVKAFPHHNAAALDRLARHAAQAKLRPVIVTDGYCPGCGKTAPLGWYSGIATAYNGYLVLDDSQALGLLGERPTLDAPYGKGGGGSLRWHQVFGPHVLVAASLAKGFGAPIAVLSGSSALIERFQEESETRVHCSPPSVAAIRATRHALQMNHTYGEVQRRRLAELVARLRQCLTRAGLIALRGLPFPVQSFFSAHWPDAGILYRALLQRGVRALLTRACDELALRLTFLVTARHRLAEIDFAGRALDSALRPAGAHLSHCTEASCARP